MILSMYASQGYGPWAEAMRTLPPRELVRFVVDHLLERNVQPRGPRPPGGAGGQDVTPSSLYGELLADDEEIRTRFAQGMEAYFEADPPPGDDAWALCDLWRSAHGILWHAGKKPLPAFPAAFLPWVERHASTIAALPVVVPDGYNFGPFSARLLLVNGTEQPDRVRSILRHPPFRRRQKMNRSPEETALVRRNLLIALLAGMDIRGYASDPRVDLVLTFYGSSSEEQDALSRTHRLLRPTRLWQEGGRGRFDLEQNLGLYLSQGSNAELDMSQMVDVGRIAWRVLTADEPERANGDVDGLAERIGNWGADGAEFLRAYRELTAH